MKKTINIILTFCMIFTLIGFVSNFVIKAEENTEIERIDLTLDEEKFYYYFNVAFKEGQLDAILDETLDVKDNKCVMLTLTTDKKLNITLDLFKLAIKAFTEK